jgi:cell division protein FtsW (lipid II flippase)
MRIVRSTAVERASSAGAAKRVAARNLELVALVAASLVSCLGLLLVYQAKAAGLAGVGEAIAARRVVDLSDVSRAEDLLPALESVLPDASERRFVAERIAAYAVGADTPAGVHRHLESVGALAVLSVSEQDFKPSRRLPALRARLAERRAKNGGAATSANTQVPLLTPAELAALKGSLIVRRPDQFRRDLGFSAVLFLAGFYLVHLWARWRRSTADPLVLPLIHVLCGIGLAAMVSLRDPVRDLPLYARFAQGVIGGSVGMAAVGLVDFQRSLLRRLSYVPLLCAIALSLLLIVFGTGPGTSDARVNLLGVQPVEAIRLLVVLFLAGYFANRWEFLRDLREPRLAAGRFGFDAPRLDYVIPVLVGMVVLLLFFFLQKDLGPALTLACVFLALYGVARKRLTMVAAGFLLLFGGFVAGYALSFPHTVVQRVQMWRSPWDNAVRGGDQVAHALWALASGGWSGAGLGLGDPQLIPAGHTDLVLAAVGEELGLPGLLVVFTLSALLAYRALRIALDASGDYTFFLALGLGLNVVFQLLLISAGLLGLMPLTGVATPWLSYGRSSMLANFVAFGILLAISERSPGRTGKPEFEPPVRWLTAALGVLFAIVIARVVFVQVIRADQFAASSALTVQADGARRFEYNPRLLAVARLIIRGTITDRNGVPMATSRPADLEAHAQELAELGVKPTEACPSPETRCYPFGGVTFHLLGDWRTQVNWAASNTSFVERDSDARLRGYDDHARTIEVVDPRDGSRTKVLRRDLGDLVPLLRHRYQPRHEAVTRILGRPRDVRLTIDMRLQAKVAEALGNGIARAGKQDGAAVVLSETGELLAAVSYPWPVTPAGSAVRPATDGTPADAGDQLLDRARYGVYPPGSSFKLVTMTAALRKDPALDHQTFTCQRLPDGRVGTRIPGWSRPIRDDPADRTPHGVLDLERALVVSCNAYFAQLGLRLGPQVLQETAGLFEISLGQPETTRQVRDTLPYAAYGQGQVLATPFKMARVAATMAVGGEMPQGRWILDESNQRTDAPRPILTASQAGLIARTMRRVVLEGTGRSLKSVEPPIAGKTGTAEVQNAPSHSWFVGFAPYGGTTSRIAFAVVVEHGGYGASIAAPIAGEIVKAARGLGIIGR